MSPPTPRTRFARAFTLVEMLVAITVLVLLVVLLAAVNNQTLQLWKRTSGQTEIFQSARLAFDTLVRQLSLATLNTYWDYDNANAPTRYLRKSDLAFVSGSTSALAVPNPGPGQAVFFQAPLGRLNAPSARQLNLSLNTCGFYVDYGNANANSPTFMSAPVRNRYRLMQLQTTAENMKAFNDTSPTAPLNTWFTNYWTDSRMLAENVVLLVVRPLAPAPGGTRVDLAATNYRLDTRAGETANPQPATANQLPPMVEITLVAVSEATMGRISATNGYQFSTADLAGRFVDPTDADYEQDMGDFEAVLQTQNLDYRVFRQQIALPNSKWSD